MTDLHGIGDGIGDGWPFDDEEAEALLAGGGTDRDELVSLHRFLHQVRAPQPALSPEPSEELVALFSGGVGRGFGAPPVEPRGVGPVGRKPVRKMVKVAVATTTAALAVTLAAAAQVLPNTQAKSSIGVSGPATPIQVGGSARASTATSEVDAGLAAGVTVPHPATTVTTRPPPTTRVAAPADVASLSADALARLPLDVLRNLPADVLVRLPVEVLRTLPADALARLPLDVLRTLPADALVRLPADVLRTLPGDALARLPLDLLMTLPADVQARLPVDVLRLLLLVTPTTATTVTTAAPRA